MKPYLYVDESGQDTAGGLFIVGIVVVFLEQRDELADTLAVIEQRTRKGQRKWMRSSKSHRLAYMREVLRMPDTVLQVFYGIHHNTRDYISATASTTADVLFMIAGSEDRATVLIDALSREGRREMGVLLRRHTTRADVRGVPKDENNSLIRLADAVAGFVRDALEGGKEENRLWRKALQEKRLRDVADEQAKKCPRAFRQRRESLIAFANPTRRVVCRLTYRLILSNSDKTAKSNLKMKRKTGYSAIPNQCSG